jgi:hypothetical protein
MQTSDLIAQLAGDLRPVPARAAVRRISLGLLMGAAASLCALLLTMGTDVREAVQTSAFWIKWGYGFSTLSIALWLCLRLARPEPASGSLLLALAAPSLVIAVLAVAQLSAAPRGEWLHLWLGRSALVCPWLILGLSVPLFMGVLWAFRKFAPAQPRLAGFASGALAGAAAAVVYALRCDETAVAFIATWYTIGMLLSAIAGALIGPRVLRW